MRIINTIRHSKNSNRKTYMPYKLINYFNAIIHNIVNTYNSTCIKFFIYFNVRLTYPAFVGLTLPNLCFDVSLTYYALVDHTQLNFVGITYSNWLTYTSIIYIIANFFTYNTCITCSHNFICTCYIVITEISFYINIFLIIIVVYTISAISISFI